MRCQMASYETCMNSKVWQHLSKYENVLIFFLPYQLACLLQQQTSKSNNNNNNQSWMKIKVIWLKMAELPWIVTDSKECHSKIKIVKMTYIKKRVSFEWREIKHQDEDDDESRRKEMCVRARKEEDQRWRLKNELEWKKMNDVRALFGCDATNFVTLEIVDLEWECDK